MATSSQSAASEHLERIFSYIRRNKGKVLKYGIAIFLAVVWIIPFFGLFMASIRPYEEIVHGWWNFGEFTLTLKNFSAAWNYASAPMSKALLNSAIVTIPAVLLSVLFGAMTAYPFARFDFPMRKVLFFLLILIMAAPPEIIAMTNYSTLHSLGLFDNYLGLILVHVGWGLGWCVLFFRNYMLTIPSEMEEAAQIDGASRFEIFKSVILPLAGPAIVSVAVIQFTWIWNAVFFPMVFMRSASHYLAPQALPLQKGRIHVAWGRVSAASIMTMMVPVILFILLQRYYKKGLTGAAIQK